MLEFAPLHTTPFRPLCSAIVFGFGFGWNPTTNSNNNKIKDIHVETYLIDFMSFYYHFECYVKFGSLLFYKYPNWYLQQRLNWCSVCVIVCCRTHTLIHNSPPHPPPFLYTYLKGYNKIHLDFLNTWKFKLTGV